MAKQKKKLYEKKMSREDRKKINEIIKRQIAENHEVLLALAKK